jgi:anti-sigma B factor antagonist
VATAKDPPSEPTELPSADDHSTGLFDVDTSAAGETAGYSTFNATSELLGLTVKHPTVGIRVVTVDGELDMATAPLLASCLQEQLNTQPNHLIVDLQPLSFLDSSGLNCLLEARESAQITATQLHLAGLDTRAVARPLQISHLLDLFNPYPTLADAFAAILSES